MAGTATSASSRGTTTGPDCALQPESPGCPVAPANASLEAGPPWLWLIAIVALMVATLVLLCLWLVALRRTGRVMAALDEAHRVGAEAQSRIAAAEAALHRAEQSSPRPNAADAPPPGLGGPPPSSSFDRELADQVIELADLATAPAVEAQADRVLRRLGIEALPVQVGDPLDPHRHLVVGSVTTADPQQNERVSAVIRPGWARRGAILRPASVTVWVTS